MKVARSGLSPERMEQAARLRARHGTREVIMNRESPCVTG